MYRTIETKPDYIYTPEERTEALREFKLARASVGMFKDELIADITLSAERSISAAIVWGAYRVLPPCDEHMSTNQHIYFINILNRWLRGRGHA